MKRKNTEKLGLVIDRYLKIIGADKRLKEIRLQNRWEEIIGKNIASKTQKITIRDGVVHLLIPSSIVKNELRMVKTEIIRRFNEASNENIIKDVKIY